MKTSDLENDIKRRLAAALNRDEFDGIKKQLSCRISIVRHYQIGVLADRLNTTRTDLAEDLLEQAIEIAWNAAGFGAFSEEDIKAMKALATAPPVRKQEFFPEPMEATNRTGEGWPSAISEPQQTLIHPAPPDRLDCFTAIFEHLGQTRGRVKGAMAASRDGTMRVCCLTSKNYEAASETLVGERYWSTIYEHHLEALQQVPQNYVAFACGSVDQIVLVPTSEFRKWCSELPPYTQGKTGWHVHISHLSRQWEIRRKGKGEPPLDVTRFVI